jgi:hypothetical protein
MSPQLTYRPREGVVFGTVAGRTIRLATLRTQAAMNMEAWQQAVGPVAPDIYDWRKVQELRTGGLPAGTFARRLTVAENAALEVYDYPGEYAQRFDGIDRGGAAGGSTNHRHHSRVVLVRLSIKTSFPAGGLCLHGPPPCGNPRCIVIVEGWDSLFQALKATRQASIVVEL